jgi:hypothetical protein
LVVACGRISGCNRLDGNVNTVTAEKLGTWLACSLLNVRLACLAAGVYPDPRPRANGSLSIGARAVLTMLANNEEQGS